MEKKNLYSIIAIVTIIVIAGIIFAIYSPNTNLPSTNVDSNTNIAKLFYIDKEGPIPLQNCTDGNIQNKIIIIESKYCGACKVFKEVTNLVESKTDYKFNTYDVTESDKYDFIKNVLHLDFKYTPTMIVACNAYIGVKDENTLLDILSQYQLE